MLVQQQQYVSAVEGSPPDPQMQALLENQLTVGYVPSLPVFGMFTSQGMPQMFLRRDTELMITHPVVRQALRYFKGGIAGAEFWGGPNPDSPDDENGLPVCIENDEVGKFVKEQCERFWDRGVPHLQSAYDYGWIGSEQKYEDEDGLMKWAELFTFDAADTYLLTQDFRPIGVRVKNVRKSSKPVDLWMAGDNVPAKGLWYAHQPRYNSFYGQSQLLGAWRPWRRLAWIDGAETVIDGAFYRFGYRGPIVRYPNEDLMGPSGIPNTTLNSQGQPMRYARDIARQIGEQLKAGGTVGLPSTRDSSGEYKWAIDIPEAVLSGIAGLIEYADYLADQITQGIGVPPELLEAADSGSGYSGRRIPLEAFLANQQQIADAILKLFVDQILRPLVHWNFGPVKFNVQVKSLIKTRTKAAQAANPGQQNPQPGQLNQQPGNQQTFNQQQQPTQVTQQNQNLHQQQGVRMSLVTDRVREIARKISSGR